MSDEDDVTPFMKAIGAKWATEEEVKTGSDFNMEIEPMHGKSACEKLTQDDVDYVESLCGISEELLGRKDEEITPMFSGIRLSGGASLSATNVKGDKTITIKSKENNK